MYKQKIITILVILAMFLTFAIPASAQETTSENLFKGLIAACSKGHDSYPVKNLTDGLNRDGTGESRTIIYKLGYNTTSAKNGTIAWLQFNLSSASTINKIYVQHSLNNGSPRISVDNIAIDVRLATGGWQRVAADYNIADLKNAIIVTFPKVDAVAVRISFNCGNQNAAVLTEVEGYYDSTLTGGYTGIETDEANEIPELLANMNLFRGITASVSNVASTNLNYMTDGNNNALENYSKVLNIANTDYAWVQFNLPQAKPINKLVIQQRWISENSAPLSKVADIAVDVLLFSGGWKRVAALYGLEAFYSAHTITFKQENVVAVRITTNGARYNTASFCPTEIEGYFDSSITENFTGIGTAQAEYAVPEVLSSMNLLSGIIPATSGGTADTDVDYITNSYNERESAPASIHNEKNTDNVWVEFKLPEAKPINRIFIMQKFTTDGNITSGNKCADIAVEVKVGEEWKRVASMYQIETFYSGNVITFDAVTADAIRVRASGKSNNRTVFYVSEIEANYYSSLADYTGIGDSMTDLRDVILGNETNYTLSDINCDNVTDVRDIIALRNALIAQ